MCMLELNILEFYYSNQEIEICSLKNEQILIYSFKEIKTFEGEGILSFVSEICKSTCSYVYL